MVWEGVRQQLAEASRRGCVNRGEGGSGAEVASCMVGHRGPSAELQEKETDMRVFFDHPADAAIALQRPGRQVLEEGLLSSRSHRQTKKADGPQACHVVEPSARWP